MWLCRCTDGREFRGVLKDALRANVVDIAAIADQLLYHRQLTPGAHAVRDITRRADVCGLLLSGHGDCRSAAFFAGHMPLILKVLRRPGGVVKC